MYGRYMEIEEDMPLPAAEDRGRYIVCEVRMGKTNVFYLLLSSSTFFFLQGKLSLRKVNK